VEDQQPAAGDLTESRPPQRNPRRWRPRRARTGSSVARTESVDNASDAGAPPACGGEPGAAVGAEAAETEAAQSKASEDESEAKSAAESTENSEAETQPAEGVLDGVGADRARGADGATASEGESDEAACAGTISEGDNAPARRRVGKRLAIAVGVAAALFVGSAAFAGATVQPYLADQATVATKLQIARTAADAITTLWTYTPDNMNTLADRSAKYLSGDFEFQYRKFVDGIAATNKQAQITNSTQVTGAAVESLSGPEAVAIVYTNTTSTSPLTKGIPSLKYLSYRLFMKRDHARWLVTRMTTITSLDLTPRV
jgi:Mce-associated membrane protein